MFQVIRALFVVVAVFFVVDFLSPCAPFYFNVNENGAKLKCLFNLELYEASSNIDISMVCNM